MTKSTLFRVWLALLALTAVVVTVLYFRHPGRPLTRENLEEAKALWASVGPHSYSMKVIIDGAQDNTMDIVVTNGKVTSLNANGVVPAESTWSYWTVEGMFEFLKRELDQMEAKQATLGIDEHHVMVLKVHYHDQLGFPQVFFRYIKNHPSNIRWKVTKFKRQDL